MVASAAFDIRRARLAESDEAAAVIVAARHASVPAIPPMIHTDDEVLGWFREFVMATQEVWVARAADEIVGTLVLSPGWVEQLYVEPGSTGRGIGAALLDQAKSESAGHLDLWTFVSNTGAQRFYERHGFVEIARTDGDNEDVSPDIRYRWSRV